MDVVITSAEPIKVVVTCDKPDVIEVVDAEPLQVVVSVTKDGNVGPQGPAGPQGLKGDKGDTGNVGPQGPAGPQGLKGDKGDTGNVGPQGPAGPQGLKGDKGDTGNVGPQGPAGPQGLKGDKGDTGNVGPQGPAGPQGLKGDKGDVADLLDFQTKKGFYLFEDFLGAGLAASSLTGWSGESSGAGSSIITVNSYPNRTNQQGVLRLATGTTSAGLAQGRLGDNNIASHYLGNGIYTIKYFVNIETLSDFTNRFYSLFGATTNAAFANTNGIFFIYDEGIGTYGAASPNWRCITRNGIITSTNTGIPVVASRWYNLEIVINANASSVEFFIDGVSAGPPHTTNIPSIITPRFAQVKTIGSLSRNAYVDYSLVQQIYTNSRTI